MPNVQVPGVGVVAFPDSMSQEQIVAAIKKMPQQGGPSPNAVASSMARAGGNRLLEQATRNLPTAAGGLIGGMIGGIPGATIGGTAGHGLGQAGADRLGFAPDQSSSDFLGFGQVPNSGPWGMAKGGVGQGAMETGGRALMGAARAIAPHIMRLSMNPPSKLVAETVESGSRPPWMVNMEERIPIDRTGLSGQATARMRQEGAAKTAEGLADASPETFTPRAVLKRVGEMVDRLRNKPLSEGEQKALLDMGEEFIGQHTSLASRLRPRRNNTHLTSQQEKAASIRRSPLGKSPLVDGGEEGVEQAISARDLIRMKQFSDRASSVLRNKIARGADIPHAELKELFYKAVGDETRAMLAGKVPGLGAANRKTSELVGLNKAMKFAENRPVPPPHLINPLSWPGVNLVANPEVGSRLALGMTGRAGQGVLGQSPRALGFTMGMMGPGQGMKQPDEASLRANLATAQQNGDEASAELIRQQLRLLGADSGVGR